MLSIIYTHIEYIIYLFTYLFIAIELSCHSVAVILTLTYLLNYVLTYLLHGVESFLRS